MVSTADLTLASLRAAYASGSLTPTALCQQLLPRIEASTAVFIVKPKPEDVIERCKFLENQAPAERGALWGIPFAVKDNIDVAGYPTTCSCPDFAYTPAEHASTVKALLDAGGIMVGKTNLDQFACGLVGTRTPYGVAPNAFDSRFTPGGSSSGSAVAVASAMATFALGTDTAGSGRVPAGQNGIVGIKPSVGRFSTKGVVPACYLLDCVSVFALTVEDGAEVARVLENKDIGDATYRLPNAVNLTKGYTSGSSFRFALPNAEYLEDSFKGPGGEVVRAAMKQQMDAAVERLRSIGGELVEIDFAPFATTAVLLYGAAFVAERYAGIKKFLEARDPSLQRPQLLDLTPDERLLKVTRAIINKTHNFNSADVFEGLQQLSELRGAARLEMAKFDVLVVPTVAYNYTVKEIQEEEDEPELATLMEGKVAPTRNTNLGRWTNFVNLLDMCGVSVFSGLMHLTASQAAEGLAAGEEARRQHLAATGNPSPVLPFGITLLAPSWTDEYVAGVAATYEKATGLKPGPVGHGVQPYVAPQ